MAFHFYLLKIIVFSIVAFWDWNASGRGIICCFMCHLQPKRAVSYRTLGGNRPGIITVSILRKLFGPVARIPIKPFLLSVDISGEAR